MVILACAVRAMACMGEANDHNYYVFSVIQRDCMNPAYLQEIDDFWKKYAGQTDNPSENYYKWNQDDVMAAAEKKGDRQMIAYMTLLNRYLKVCSDMAEDSWEYPTKQEIAQRRQTLISILNTAKAYKGKSLASMYALLRMRADMMLGNDKANASYWLSTASKLTDSPWKEAMRNIYARSLLKAGQRIQACDIYASQGDMTSIKWVARKYRNLAGIESIYYSEPNAPTLVYLVQDFVNNVQQTIDLNPKTDSDLDWMKSMGGQPIYLDEVRKFITFADKVLAEGRTASPCLWRSATAMLHYMLGDHQLAADEAANAMSLNGTQRMKDNARAIRLLALTVKPQLGAAFSSYLIGEMEWLDEKITADRVYEDVYANHYTNVKERIIYRNLIPLYLAQGDSCMAMALDGMQTRYENSFNQEDAKYKDKSYLDVDYQWVLDSISAAATLAYYRFLTTRSSDSFVQYVKDRVYADADFFNELIGTKYMREGDFDEAAAYLRKVPQPFIDGQRISFYMAQRSYAVPRWFVRQKPKGEEAFLDISYEGRYADAYAHVGGNVKLQFCEEMSRRISRYNLSGDGEDKEQQAYDLAVRFYQASCYGDCWYLTHYSTGCCDSACVGELDYAAQAVRYLNVVACSSSLDLRYKAIYALAFMPVDPWYKTVWDANYNDVICPLPNSGQYQALVALERFAMMYPQVVDHYTTRCDVLQRFRSVRNQSYENVAAKRNSRFLRRF